MDEPALHDFSRLDAFMAGRRRVSLLKAVALPMLAGLAGAALVIAAVYVTLPKFTTRDVEIPRVVYKDAAVPNIVPRDVEVDHIVPHDVEVDRLAPRAPPLSPEAFIASEPFRAAVVKGRFAGPDRNGFRLDNGQTFYPARLVGGRVDLATDLLDDVSKLSVGDPIYCAPAAPEGLFECRAFHQGKVETIIAIPVGRPS